MSKATAQTPGNGKGAEPRRLFGLTRKQRIRIYLWSALALVLAFGVWTWTYLRPGTWYTYTDQVAFKQTARDVKLGHVMWEPAVPETAGIEEDSRILQPSISSDGAHMVFALEDSPDDTNLYLRRWNGSEWGKARPLRALNSAFHETGPSLSGDGEFLFFSSDRPGGRGGKDIWVAKWDGNDFAWPLPLTGRVNTPFDEIDPSLSPDGARLYFSSNRPYVSEEEAIQADIAASREILADVTELKSDFDLYAADTAGENPFDLIVERQLSMLYSLREGALADEKVMRKLGGTRETETAVDRGLEFLARTQEEDGRWDIRKHGGQGGHDVAATSFALLAYYGRGERHDRECKYQDTVKRGLEWLLSQQDRASGDLRGPKPVRNAMYDMGIATLALVEAYGVTKDSTLRPRVIAALEFCEESQHAEGGWRYQPGERGDLSATGWYIMALASAEMSGIPVSEEMFAGAKKFLRAMSGGQHGGSYGYTASPGKRNSGRPGMNAAGFFCAQLLGDSPNAYRAHESAAILAKEGAKHNDLYYVYYGTLAAYQFQGPLWDNWRKKMQQDFLRTQAQDGSWRPSGSHGGAMGKVVGTAITVLCLEAHYRYTPLYGLGYEPLKDPLADARGFEDVAETPLFRHAKFLEPFNSPADDTAPVITEHGDFLYFASNRDGGIGAFDLYRSRISGTTPKAPENLGEDINSPGNDTNPALRHAGFHLVFNSDREGPEGQLFSARSRRLVRAYDYTQLPSMAWMGRNFPWILAFVGAIAACGWLTRRALIQGRHRPATPATEASPS